LNLRVETKAERAEGGRQAVLDWRLVSVMV
jgi:hypothetical protein